ncbi:glycine betaine/L-proline ABC transporter ATP-binding protein [Rhizobium ruizarguesonis]|uniref:Quaternary amine transport ATP-binding protein n=2 Tax=Rhizobium ruizarguesonis TaxID=2081791 RepID=A0ABY1WWJ0_9HYPH|nr:glycine betaine/L-proline ABC transporter ATP-binding protein [Rhizobium ruizarguesonis]MBC2808272.1 glycine betaine/L-proline ABC transporter ATP-binding protein [Rhizobium ruizarguesonis]TAU28298.1 glycine betaine/L-proline ABC transporter ATP-binding protein [Rhizobium ruizarguesonis]TAU57189.1 glycine betaine/L-proline ABC transporter ATP-binding protein [Rhizobium ruizarguesonis]TAU60678.1 glycine betaine/L-proline ABC transporter ATP-binding protein [Rhizobium ruizarguesonis]TAV01556.
MKKPALNGSMGIAMKTVNADINDVLIDCQSLWKVFGDKSAAAMKSIKERGLGKKEVLKEFNCVVGVSDASIEVRRGEIFCIMGLSGSGKSTLIRLLNKLITPSSGKVLVKGRDLAALSPVDLRQMRARNIGMVFQSVALLPHRTVLENAAFGLEVQGIAKPERNKTAVAALEKVGLTDWVNRYPNELSGGMQQRVGLARALASDPEIILMDEPFSALDPLIRRQLQDEFRQLTKALGKSAVFITHDLDEAIRIGDRIAIMKDGVIIQTGTAEEIILNPADAYVAEFVAGISRLHLIKAHSVMRSVAEFQQSAPNSDIASLARTTPDADIDELITLTMQSERDAIAVVDNDQIVGVVTPRSLLMGVKGTSTHDLTPASHNWS